MARLARVPRTLALALAGVTAVLVLLTSFVLAQRATLADMREAQETTLRSRVQALESTLSRQRAVATVLADDAAVRAALGDPREAKLAAVSQKLARLREETDSAVIYLLDLRGIALAASNWRQPDSFVGADYSFRDYYRQALRDGSATQFALGTVSNRPGLYLSHDIRTEPGGSDQPARALGVVVVKVEFDRLEAEWRQAGDLTYVLDGAGQIILSSQPDLRFVPPAPVGRALASRQAVPGTAWSMVLVSSSAPAAYAGGFAAGSAGFLLLLAAVIASLRLRARRRARRAAEAERRYRIDLERAVDERTRALSEEIRERRAAEERLDRLRGEMVQANKLAALGQITAGVAHEVNQPLAAIRLLAENGIAMMPSDAAPELAGNMDSILRMTDRISRITQELRGFARKATGDLGPVVLAPALEVAALLTAGRRKAEGIQLELPKLAPDLSIQGETVRLEQILVNLLQNAQEALSGRAGAGLIRVLVDADDQRVRIAVEDNGPGLAPQIARQLFTPFATSKPQGLGLGLVISQDIARDFGGSLRAEDPPGGQGARFVLDLPRAA
ncbi:sensor histidine kinase [Paracoccus limosus]|uniref:histidine kinase n=2 Tax=Paracoccus limosus TaxID=913252 RepID=A0A844H235_9RHOB|nr:ATP-binding protein [Paracoccus limosus]MTH34979.1 sensor histidine kinase [Paracoccus limosus]